jgi:hypothetical protein
MGVREEQRGRWPPGQMLITRKSLAIGGLRL